MAVDAVLFDLDGTLVDANRAHTETFVEAFRRYGYTGGDDQVARLIGKGGDILVETILGEQQAEEHGEPIRKLQGELYLERVGKQQLDVLPRVPELIKALKARGLRTAIATASKEEYLEAVMENVGLRLVDLVDAVVTDSDVERSKPRPDVVTAAAAKLGLSPAQCVMVGDTPYDIEAARRGGVAAIGVKTGVWNGAELRRAGARAVYDDTGALLADLDNALHAASPYELHLTQDVLEKYMRIALEEGRLAMEDDDAPIGAVLVRGDGEVLARGHNRERTTGNPLAHAEVVIFSTSGPALANHRGDLLLFSTLEPCIMCHGAILQARIDTAVYALEAPADGGWGRCAVIDVPGAVPPRPVGHVLRDEGRALMAEWAQRHPEDAFTRDLLQRTEKLND